ncbi:S-adenosylmethionine mitochondrial carrier protein [Striga asiatica]|uniref:S-adenosylmethionine mitochondrial carrier protein n=1 Tax=Striga asiatica TaxID=4170 RepID=A0A5A7QZE6_STRAF|nr:S-adenosylmethionine mitochondrial carrier protein [Striga asiatica]
MCEIARAESSKLVGDNKRARMRVSAGQPQSAISSPPSATSIRFTPTFWPPELHRDATSACTYITSAICLQPVIVAALELTRTKSCQTATSRSNRTPEARHTGGKTTHPPAASALARRH